jgi:hypothetical protein
MRGMAQIIIKSAPGKAASRPEFLWLRAPHAACRDGLHQSLSVPLYAAFRHLLSAYAAVKSGVNFFEVSRALESATFSILEPIFAAAACCAALCIQT